MNKDTFSTMSIIVNHTDGYRYEISEYDDGMIRVEYFEDIDTKPKESFHFPADNANAIINAIQKVVDFHKKESK